ncbi:MAG: Hsp20/alpha crystallin family protein [Chitinispirillaceae bacterium]|nr:Hsp20/alpha crystallin family protein [Chitinispirillaceae bacterium]
MKSLIPWRNSRKHAAPARSNDWFDRVWEDSFSDFFPGVSDSFPSRLPSVDVSEDKKEVTVRAEIPGMSEKEIDLTWYNGVLSIRGEKRDEKEEKKKDRFYRECSYGSFYRSIPVGNGVDWQNAKAKYKNGVLTVSLPKSETAQKAIEIKVQ